MSLPSSTPPRAYRFGPFELDLASGELRRHGLKVRLRGRPIEILVCLIEGRPGVVSREDLRARLWSSDTFVDFDHGLNSAMNRLREALGDMAEHPRYVETVPRRGYRFIGQVEVVEDPTSVPAPDREASTAPAVPPPDSPPAPLAVERPSSARAPWARMRFWVVAAMVVAAVALAGWVVKQRGRFPLSGRAMLVVLPFENRSGNAEDEFFSDGVTDEMIAHLGALDPERLGVIARTTSMQYKGSRKGVMEIGRELGVAYLLEGSVRRDAQRVRITAQLVDVGSQTQLWTETYERDVRDVLMLQRDVAARVAQSLAGGALSPVLARATRRSPSFSAYERVLRGRAARQQATEEGLRQCVALFEEAIALDAEYAAAHAGRADCYRLLGGPGWEVGPPAELLEQARISADTALEIDPELPEGYAARGMVRFSYDWNLPGAERDLSRAIQLNPSYARAHQYRSAVLTAMGRFDAAIQSARHAHELDPLSVTESTTLGVRLYYGGRYDEAIGQLMATSREHPEFPVMHWGLAQTYRELQRHKDAVAAMRVAVERAGGSAYMRAWLAHALAVAGDRDEAVAIRDELRTLAERRYMSPFLFGLMAAGLGERDDALGWLERVRDSKSGWMPFLPVEPEFASFRGDPRFQALTSRIRTRAE